MTLDPRPNASRELRRSAAGLTTSALFACALLMAGASFAQDGAQPEGDPAPKASPTPAPAGTPAPKPADPPAAGPKTPADLALQGVPYFPLTRGRRWVYRLTYAIESIGASEGTDKPKKTPTAEHRLDAYVAAPQTLSNKQVSVLEWKLDTELAQRSYYRVEEGKLLCLRRLQSRAENVKEFLMAPFMPVCKVGIKVGDEWVWEGKIGQQKGKQTCKVVREEEVETGAGKFKALVLVTKYEGEEDSGTQTRWLVKGVGIVKETSEVKTPLHVIRTEGTLVKVVKK